PGDPTPLANAPSVQLRLHNDPHGKQWDRPQADKRADRQKRTWPEGARLTRRRDTPNRDTGAGDDETRTLRLVVEQNREGEKRGKKGEAELRIAPSVGAQGDRQQQRNCTRELNGPTRPARAKPDSQQPHHGETKHEVGRVAP